MEIASSNWKTKFALLWTGQAVSLLTSSVLQMAIVWYLTERTGSAMVVTLATLIGYVPQAVLGMFTGVFIDRYDRKKIMMVSDLGIAAAGVLLAIVGFDGDIPIPMIYAMLFIRSVGAAFHSPSLTAIIPAIVPEDSLTKCAGYSQSFESVSLLLSPALAAVLFSSTSLSFIIMLDVLGAGIAVMLLLLIKVPVNKSNTSMKLSSVFTEIKDGLKILRDVKGMIPLMIVGTCYAFIYFPIGSLYPVMTMTYFNGTIRDSGTVEVIFSVGMLLGSLVLGKLGDKLPKMATILASIGIYGVGVIVSGLLSPADLYLFTAMTLIMGLTVPFFYGMNTAIFQIKIPNEYLGRALSLSYSIRLIAMPLGLTLGGSVSEFMGINYCFLFAGILCVLLAVVSGLMPSMRKLF